MRLKKGVALLYFIILFISIFGISTLSKYKSSSKANQTIETASFKIKLNEDTKLTQSIDLKNTITPNNYSDKYLMPGTNGNISLVLDFSEVDVSTDYTISLGKLDLPNNLQLYIDDTFTTEFTSLNDIYDINDSKTHTHNIYWKWHYKTDEESNKNDNNFMNKDLSIPIIIKANQKIGGGN